MYCYKCGDRARSGATQCKRCGGWHFAAMVKPVIQKTPRLKPSAWPWNGISWPRGLAMLSGSKGSGKSSLAAVLRPHVYFTTEQTPAEVARSLSRIQGPTYKTPWVGVITAADEIPGLLGGLALPAAPLVVVDSLTELGLEDAVEAVKTLNMWAERTGGRALVITQRTKDGQAAGRERLPHLVDVVLSIDTGSDGLRRLAVEKNRHGDLGTVYFGLGSNGVVKPEFPAAYSVEGGVGDYRLVPYPSRDAQWADPWEVEGVALEGRATAYRRAKGYRSGWLAPADALRRQAFAEAHGLEWFDPRGA